MNTTIVKWENSREVRLPKALTDALSLQENDAIPINVENNAIGIRKPSLASLQELFEGYSGDISQKEWDTGTPVGREVW